MAKISIIIPIYNVEKYIRQCLDSVINQTLRDIEIICVNDCSPDNSLSILEEYAKKDNRIKVINLKENVGLGTARNIAMKQITSEYVMFLDPDDWYEINSCEQAYNQISKNKNDFVVFKYKIINESENNKIYESKTFIKKYEPLIGIINANKKCFKESPWGYSQCWNKIYSHKFISSNNIVFSKGYFEDNIFYVKIMSISDNFSYIDKCLYNYRKRNGSITTKTNSLRDCFNNRIKCYKYLKYINSEYLIQYLNTVINSNIHYYKKLTKNNYKKRKFYYKHLHNSFKMYNEENNIELIKNNIDYTNFMTIVKNKTYESYAFHRYFLQKIFSINCSYNRKIIYILGTKFSFKTPNIATVKN